MGEGMLRMRVEDFLCGGVGGGRRGRNVLCVVFWCCLTHAMCVTRATCATRSTYSTCFSCSSCVTCEHGFVIAAIFVV